MVFAVFAHAVILFPGVRHVIPLFSFTRSQALSTETNPCEMDKRWREIASAKVRDPVEAAPQVPAADPKTHRSACIWGM